MVPEPSTTSPPIPFIGAEAEWEVPYIASPGRTGKVEGRRKADRAPVSTPKSQNAGWEERRDWIGRKGKGRRRRGRYSSDAKDPKGNADTRMQLFWGWERDGMSSVVGSGSAGKEESKWG